MKLYVYSQVHFQHFFSLSCGHFMLFYTSCTKSIHFLLLVHLNILCYRENHDLYSTDFVIIRV